MDETPTFARARQRSSLAEPAPAEAWGDDREFINAVVWIAKTGAPCRDLPERFGSWKTVYNRFNEWSKKGVFTKVFKALQIDVDEDGSMVDASVIRAHQHAAGGKGGPKAMLWDALEELSRRFFYENPRSRRHTRKAPSYRAHPRTTP